MGIWFTRPRALVVTIALLGQAGVVLAPAATGAAPVAAAGAVVRAAPGQSPTEPPATGPSAGPDLPEAGARGPDARESRGSRGEPSTAARAAQATTARPLGAPRARPSLPFGFREPTTVLDSNALDVPLGSGTFQVFDVITADVDGNGSQDVVSQLHKPGPSPQRFLAVQRADGFGGFEAGVGYYLPVDSGSGYYREGGVAAADVDDDGDLDLVMGDGRGLTLTTLVNAGDGTFPTQVSTPVSIRLDRSLLVRDLDGDDVPDVAAVSQDGDGVQLFTGAGDGTFIAGPLLAHSDAFNVAAITLGADLVLVSTSRTEHVKYWHKSAGVWSETNTGAPAGGGLGAWVGDFDGDGDEDLGVLRVPQDPAAHSLKTSIVVPMRNDGGTLTALAPASGPAGLPYVDLPFPRLTGETDDIDGDGRDDLVVAGWVGEAVVLYGDATDGLSGRAVYAAAPGYEPDAPLGWDSRDPAWIPGWGTGRETVGAELADVTGDGKVDIVTATGWATPANAGAVHGEVSVVQGRGGRAFAASKTTSGSMWRWDASPYYDDAHLVDWDGDGRDDLVTLVIGKVGYQPEAVLARGVPGGFATPQRLGNDDQTFTSSCIAALSTRRSLVEDVDGDGALDVVCADHSLAYLPGDGSGGVEAEVDLGEVSDTPSLDVSGLALGDLDGDGDKDLVYATRKSGSDRVWVGWAERLAAGFAAPSLITSIGVDGATHTFPNAAVTEIADLDGDGILDVARLGQTIESGTVKNRLFVLLGNGTGGFTQSVVDAPVAGLGSVDALDLDGDGDLDLVTSYEEGLGNYGQSAAAVALLRGDGDGGFTTYQTFPTKNAGVGGFRVADLNGDDVVDLLATTNYRGVELRPGTGSGSFGPPVPFGIPDRGMSWVETIDVDDDGDLDVIGRTMNSSAGYVGALEGVVGTNLAILENTGPAGGPADLRASVSAARTSFTGAERVTLTVSTENHGGGTAVGPWTDAVWLSQDDTWDVTDTLVATVPRTTLPAGDHVDTELEVDLMPLRQGGHHLIVRSDARGQLTEADEADNEATTAVGWTLPTLAPGGSLAVDGDPAVVRIASSSTPLRLTAGDGSEALAVRLGRVPTDAAAEQRLGGPGSLVLLPGGERYLTVDGATNLSLQALPFGAGSVSPVAAAAAGSASFTVRGVGLDRADGFALRSAGGAVRQATRVRLTEDGDLTGTVDLAGANPGRWSVVVTDGATESVLSEAVRVVNGAADGTVRTSLFVPPRARMDGTATAFITYANDGLTDVALPIYRLRSAGASAPAGADYVLGDTVLFPDHGTGSVLPPGTSARMEVKFRIDGTATNGLPADVPWPQRGAAYLFVLEEYGADSIEPYDAAADYATELAALSEPLRSRVKDELVTRLGTTGGSWVQAMHRLRAGLKGSAGSHPQLAYLRGVALTKAKVAAAADARVGTVRTPDGVLADGLPVLLVDAAGAEAVTTTGEDGRWVVTGIGPPVALFVEGWGPGPVAEGSGAQVTSVTLPAWPRVKGTVTDADGDPVSGATVLVGDEPGDEGSVQVDTAADGGFVLRHVAPGAHTLAATQDDLGATQSITVGAATLVADIQLPEPPSTAELTGVVTAGGTPVSGAEVTVAGAEPETTGIDGTYAIEAPVGDGLVTVTADGYLDDRATVEVADGATHDVELLPASELVVTTVDGAGDPVAGVQVLAETELADSTVLVTDADGAASGVLPAGPVSVTVGTETREVTLPAGGSQAEEFVIDTVTLTGTLSEGGPVVWAHHGDGSTESVTTDEDGVFAVGATPGEALELRVVDPVLGLLTRSLSVPATDTDLGLLEPSGVDLTIELPWRSGPGDTSQVYLRHSDSADAEYTLVVPTVERVVDVDTLVMSDVPPGDYTVEVESADGLEASSAEVTVAGADVSVTTTAPAPRPTPRAARALPGSLGAALGAAVRDAVARDAAPPPPLSETAVEEAILDAFLGDPLGPLPHDVQLILDTPYPTQPADGCSIIETALLKRAKDAADVAASFYADLDQLTWEIRKQVLLYAGEAALRAVIVIDSLINAFVSVGKIVKTAGNALTAASRGSQAITQASIAAEYVNASDAFLDLELALQEIADHVDEAKEIPDLIGKAALKFQDAVFGLEPTEALAIISDLVKEIGPLALTLFESINDVQLGPKLTIFKELLGPISAVMTVIEQLNGITDAFNAAMITIDVQRKNREQAEWVFAVKQREAHEAWLVWLRSDKTPTPLYNPRPDGCDPLPKPPPPSPGPRPRQGPYAGTTMLSNDPNEITGPAGVGTERWIHPAASMFYDISFENLGPGSEVIPPGQEIATAPAARVSVTMPLQPWVDLDRVALGEFGFGVDDVVFTPPPGAQSFTEERPYTVTVDDLVTGDPVDLDLLLRASAAVKRSAREVVWTIELVDPATGLPHPDPLAGFLPPEPEDTPGAGQGYARVELGAVGSTATGDVGVAQASIVFDANPAITTNEWRNSFDRTAPSAVTFTAPAGGVVPGGSVLMAAPDQGSGAGLYDVWRSVDGGPLTLWLHAATANQVTLDGTVGQRISLAARATDLVGNAGTVPPGTTFTTVLAAGSGPGPTPPSSPDVPGVPVITSFKVVKKPTSRRSGVVSIAVSSSTGAAVGGTVQVRLTHKGLRTKVVTATVQDGVARLKVPRLAPGRWLLRAVFTSALGSASAGPWRLKVRR